MDRAVLILNGPRVDVSTDAILDACTETVRETGVVLECRRHDEESMLQYWLESEAERFAGLIVNPGVCVSVTGIVEAAHAISERGTPLVEVHLENIFESDEDAGPTLAVSAHVGFICGLGLKGYGLALASIAARLASTGH